MFKQLCCLLAASVVTLAATPDVAKPDGVSKSTPVTKPDAPGAKRFGKQDSVRQPLFPTAVEGVTKEELAKIQVAALKAFTDESVQGARERLVEARTRLANASGAEKKDVAMDARRATDEIRSSTMAAIRKTDESIKLESLEKVMDALEEKRAKVLDGFKKAKGANGEEAPKKKAT